MDSVEKVTTVLMHMVRRRKLSHHLLRTLLQLLMIRFAGKILYVIYIYIYDNCVNLHKYYRIITKFKVMYVNFIWIFKFFLKVVTHYNIQVPLLITNIFTWILCNGILYICCNYCEEKFLWITLNCYNNYNVNINFHKYSWNINFKQLNRTFLWWNSYIFSFTRYNCFNKQLFQAFSDSYQHKSVAIFRMNSNKSWDNHVNVVTMLKLFKEFYQLSSDHF